MYEYSEYNEYNRFPNLDGIEGKIICHLLHSTSKYTKLFWKILKYNTKDALSQPELTQNEKMELIDGTVNNTKLNANNEEQDIKTRLFFSPFIDDAWTAQASSVYIYVDNIYPIDQNRSDISLTVETVTHAKISTLYTDADLLSNPDDTNPNDYFYEDENNPTVMYKSRATVLLKCILAELNGLYIDGIGYLQFNTNKSIDGDRIQSKAELNLFNRRSFFGHSIKFNVTMSGDSDSSSVGY